MKTTSLQGKCRAILLRLSLASMLMTVSGASGEFTNNGKAVVPTIIAQLHQLILQQSNFVSAVKLEGDVCWVNSSGDLVVLQDESGVAPIWIDPGVIKTYAIQAGRELRVVVASDKITDKESETLSFNIAKKIQTEMTYPGQVKITVIRETRAISIAK